MIKSLFKSLKIRFIIEVIINLNLLQQGNLLTFIAAKFLIKGAVKTLLVEPAITATLSMIPQASLVHYSLLGKDVTLSTSHLIKFGIEKLYEKYGEQKLSFTIDKRSKTIYQIIPANKLAAEFFKEYHGLDQLILDLDKVDDYLDVLYEEDLDEIDELERELFDGHEGVIQILHDLDLAIDKANPNQLNTHDKEQLLIDEIIQKNSEIVAHSKNKLDLKRKEKAKNLNHVLDDLPKTRYKANTEEEEIKAILERLSRKDQPRKRRLA